MNTLAGIAAKASAAYGLLTSASVPILRFGSLEQAICFAWLHGQTMTLLLNANVTMSLISFWLTMTMTDPFVVYDSVRPLGQDKRCNT